MSHPVAYIYTLFSLVANRLEDRKERGATAVEYGLMVGLIAIAIITTVGLLGGQLDALFERVRVAVAGAGA